MEQYIFKDMEPKRPAEGVERWVFHGERMTMAFFRLQPGAVVPEHAHPHEQMGLVLRGSIELKVGREKAVMDAGQAYRIAPDVVHGGSCGGSMSEVLEVFSPRREDIS